MSDPLQSNSVAERLQGMPISDQALVLSRIAEGRSAGIVRPRDVSALFESMGLPPPSTIGAVFRTLKQRGLMTPTRNSGEWRVTPTGRGKSGRSFPADDVSRLIAETNSTRSAVFGNQSHALVPPSLAPPALIEPIRQFNEIHSFDTNVFCMTRFPSRDGDSQDPVSGALRDIAETASGHGLEFHLASDRAIVDELWGNVTAHMWASRYGIAIFEDRRGRGLNYNLAIEVGGMLMMGRRCLLLKDESIDRMPTDLVGMIYKSIDLEDSSSIQLAVHEWSREDLGLGSCHSCRAAA